ncbi:hypothetical protein FRC14_001410 [Serendipita sp. 396]|nr:hypothetical protein FRC14_001410 [Serendipita sp. 396]KAG8788897.1 hypothetical protein FRC15_001412 [Serendipita sp. 397]KAG8828784.1 hypothetical protein FRC19_000172 [Serendipita sp. 401]KAG8876496.1 hypothetical protein FRC20_001396 [Serendipita sp. 405]KAG9058693.1 hypothetical protein FS842_006030 [Serendipita sp. 407]
MFGANSTIIVPFLPTVHTVIAVSLYKSNPIVIPGKTNSMRTVIVHRQEVNVPSHKAIQFLQDFERLARLNPFLTSVNRIPGKSGDWEIVEDILILKIFHHHVRTTTKFTPQSRGSDIYLNPPLGVRMKTKWRVEEVQRQGRPTGTCILNAEDTVEAFPLILPFIAGKIRQARSDMMQKLVQNLLKPSPSHPATPLITKSTENRGRRVGNDSIEYRACDRVVADWGRMAGHYAP